VIAFCTLNVGLLEQFGEVLSLAYDKASMTADVNWQVGLASANDRFSIVLLESMSQMAKLKIQFGELAMQDVSNNNKVLNYVSVDDD